MDRQPAAMACGEVWRKCQQARPRATVLCEFFESKLKSFKRGWLCEGMDSEVGADIINVQECCCLSGTEQGGVRGTGVW